MRGPRPGPVPTPGTTAFVGATIIDGTGNAPLVDGVLIVSDGRIAAVGARDSVTVSPDADVIDVAGRTIIPGMVNAHDHLAQPDPENR